MVRDPSTVVLALCLFAVLVVVGLTASPESRNQSRAAPGVAAEVRGPSRERRVDGVAPARRRSGDHGGTASGQDASLSSAR
jgi:hypothetical protein